ncbi:unnamed protein product [Brassica oleracea]
MLFIVLKLVSIAGLRQESLSRHESVDEIRTTRQSQRPNPFHAAASCLLPPIVSPPPEAGRSDVEELSNLVTRQYQNSFSRRSTKGKTRSGKAETLKRRLSPRPYRHRSHRPSIRSLKPTPSVVKRVPE